MAVKRFTVELERVGKTATMFRVPFDLKEAFGRARPPVRVTIRDHTWRTTPGVYDGVGMIVVNRSSQGGDWGRRTRPRAGHDGAGHGASHGQRAGRSSGGALGGAGGEGGVRGHVVHASA